jgi:hypothetical protein
MKKIFLILIFTSIQAFADDRQIPEPRDRENASRSEASEHSAERIVFERTMAERESGSSGGGHGM